MARKKPHEDHVNHEAWAIPYGDLITLLLAFFVVMYAMSTLNEAKYRVLSDSLSEAFRGPPRSISPIQVGENMPRSTPPGQSAIDLRPPLPLQAMASRSQSLSRAQFNALLAEALSQQLADLIASDRIQVHDHPDHVSIRIGSDLLFESGSARISEPQADALLMRLAEVLKSLRFPVRVEGHTDNLPISTWQFPSNWELSAGRAAWVVRRFAELGIPTPRLSAQGYGEFRPLAGNDTREGRMANRRVSIVIDTEVDPPLSAADLSALKALMPAP